MRSLRLDPRRPLEPASVWHRRIATYRRPVLLAGGEAARKRLTPAYFERRGLLGELQRGTRVEYEHTRRFDVALSIAMDHLAESPFYYLHLDDMERRMPRW